MLAVRAARLFDGETSRPDPVVLLDGPRIAALGQDAVPPGSPVVDLGDVTLLPGLVDLHLHLVFDGSADPVSRLSTLDDEAVLAGMREAARRTLAAGVTTVRDLGDRGFLALRVRAETATDPAAGPRVLAAGPPVTTPRGHCWYLGGEVRGEAAVRAAVAQRVERGCDLVKVMASGGELTSGTRSWEPQFTVAELRAAVDEAHRHGLPVTAHAHAVEGIARALDAGVDGLEHCSFFTADGVDAADELIARIAAGSVPVSFTCGLVPGAGGPTRGVAARMDGIKAAIAKLRAAGATVVCSSDAGILPAKPHGLLPYSVAAVVAAGFPPVEALRGVTATAARVCGLDGTAGRILPGYDADLVAVPGDPLRDVSVLTSPTAVFRAGVRVA